jgi:hypothetical protein
MEFPSDILTEDRMRVAMNPGRLEEIRRALRGNGKAGDHVRISYVVPWDAEDSVRREAADLVFSQAVMEHVADLPGTIRSIARWLRSGGISSYQVDFKSHETAPGWDGHWRFTELEWAIVRGANPYLINRSCLSDHLALLREHGFIVRSAIRVNGTPTYSSDRLARRFRGLSREDRETSGVYLLAIRS